MGLVYLKCFRKMISEMVIEEKAKMAHSLCTVNVIVMDNFGSQRALMGILIASVAILESQSLHPYDEGLLESVDVTFRLHLDAVSMLTPW